jgi:hypothetical protein
MRYDGDRKLDEFPPVLIGRKGQKLTPKPLRHAEHCSKCGRVLTRFAYRDQATRREWPMCLRCARAAAPKPEPGGGLDPDAETLSDVPVSAETGDFRCACGRWPASDNGPRHQRRADWRPAWRDHLLHSIAATEDDNRESAQRNIAGRLVARMQRFVEGLRGRAVGRSAKPTSSSS